MFRVPESFRITRGKFATKPDSGNNGQFIITLQYGQTAIAIAREVDGWEQVSVSRTDRTMSYGELLQVKSLFWGPMDTILQFYPPRLEAPKDQKFWLHLWRPVGCNLPLPSAELFEVQY